MINEELFKLIELNEGFRPRVYKCPADKWTIGYGFNVEDEDLPREVADFWLHFILQRRFIPALKKIFPKFDIFTISQKHALIDMIYNLGETRLRSFKNMIASINRGDWNIARNHALDSKWAKQVGNRATRITNMFLE